MPTAPSHGRRSRSVFLIALLAVAALVFTLPAPAIAARLKLTATPTIEATGVLVTVKARGASGRLVARLQLRRSGAWETVRSGRLRNEKVRLRWTAGIPGRSYRLRTQLLRSGRVVATAPSLVAKLPKPTTSAPAKPVAPRPPTMPKPAPTMPPPAAAPGPVPTVVPIEESPSLLAVGGTQACAVDSNGQVSCWGANQYGQLGDGGRQSRPYRGLVVDLAGITEVVAGESHTCALRSDGTVWCWGNNQRNQVGPGGERSTPTPLRVGGLPPVSRLVSGPTANVTCARAATDWRCWGNDASGALVKEQTAPTPVAVSVDSIVSIGSREVCFSSLENGSRCELSRGATTVYASGALVDVDTSRSSSCAIRADSRVECRSQKPTAVTDPAGGVLSSNVFDIEGATDVEVGHDFACAARITGPVLCWGALRNSRALRLTAPTTIPGTDGITRLKAGDLGVCGRTPDARVVCWGAHDFGVRGDGILTFGEFGTGIATPVANPFGLRPSAVALGPSFACGTQAAVPSCWSNVGDQHDVAVPTAPLTTFGAVDAMAGAGPESLCGLRPSGALVCTFDPATLNGVGEAPPPLTSLPFAALDHVSAVDGGLASLCALREGELVCWSEGRLRTITPAAGEARTGVSGFANATELAVDFEQACAVRAARATCWTGIDEHAFDVPGTDGATALDVAGDDGCAVVTGALVCWTYAQTAEPSRATLQPARVIDGLPGTPSAVALGADHRCALVTGSVWCWGDGSDGQLGTVPRSGEAAGSSVPVRVPLIADAVSISAYDDTTCVTRATHDLTCWGSPDLVQHAAPDLAWTAVPVTIPN